MFFSMNLQGNSKTGNMPVTSSNSATCPNTCPLKESGCYAKNHWAAGNWKKLDNGEMKAATDFAGLIKAIKKLPIGQLWRHNEKGDLCHNDGIIDNNALNDLVKANKGKRGYTYTHHLPSIAGNAEALQKANSNGFTVNLSANNLAQADEYKSLGLPVVTVLPTNAPNVSYTPNGNKVVVCPEESKGIPCSNCGLCQNSKRDYIIGFRAHGAQKKKVEIIAKSV